MKRIISLFVVLACNACTPDVGSVNRLVLTGSSTVAPLALEIGRRFEQNNPGVRVDVQTGGSSRGIADVRHGLSNIGMVSRALKSAEQDLTAFTIARDGVGIIVHKDNPINGLSSAQILEIYTGKVHNWQAYTGEDAVITVVNKAEGRSTLEIFLDYFKLKNSEIRSDIIIGDNEQGIKTVAGNPHAIAYVSVGTAEHDIGAGVPIKLLTLDGKEAASKTIASGQYPLTRVLNLVVGTSPVGLAEAYINFARSEKVKDLVEGQNFVAVSQ